MVGLSGKKEGRKRASKESASSVEVVDRDERGLVRISELLVV